jgi:hypothetical protein
VRRGPACRIAVSTTAAGVAAGRTCRTRAGQTRSCPAVSSASSRKAERAYPASSRSARWPRLHARSRRAARSNSSHPGAARLARVSAPTAAWGGWRRADATASASRSTPRSPSTRDRAWSSPATFSGASRAAGCLQEATRAGCLTGCWAARRAPAAWTSSHCPGAGSHRQGHAPAAAWPRWPGGSGLQLDQLGVGEGALVRSRPSRTLQHAATNAGLMHQRVCHPELVRDLRQLKARAKWRNPRRMSARRS